MTDVRRLERDDLVRIRWVDASFTIEEVIPETCALGQGIELDTVGYVVHVGEEFVTVAMERSQDGVYRGACDIPIACIRGLSVLKKGGTWES